MAISIINTDRAAPLTQQEIERLPAWRRPDWQSDAEGVLAMRLDQLHGLASCLTVLARADRCRDVGDELIDDALPMLGYVMQELAVDAIRAKDVLSREHKTQTQGALQ